MLAFLKQYKVFLSGLFIAVLTGLSEVLSTHGDPSLWIIGWSVSLIVLTYLANNIRGQWASIISVVLSSAILFFQAHGDPDGLTLKEVATTVILPLAIKILGLFYTTPTKSRGYEHTLAIVQAKEQGNDIAPLLDK